MMARRFQSRAWYRFSAEPMAVLGLVLLAAITLAAILAPFVTPFPEHASSFVDFRNMSQPPSASHWFGTDLVGRDVLTRVVYGYRISLTVGIVVLGLAVPLGVTLGMIAGYAGGRLGAVIMRITDVFLAIPALVLAMAVLGVLDRTLINGLIALAVLWWPWYTRMVYNQTRAIRNEGYVVAAQVVGASHSWVLFGEILPNLVPSILTKFTLDLGFVILVASALSFLGLGVEPPTPDLGSMVAEGAGYLPDMWWMPVFPGLAILLVVLAFNLVGDGLRSMFGDGM
ncbi:MAG: ABC transporter permease [Rubellimicrobium sp.]|nr:ABC transporter permease [Rubellimicrobium sp.]